jgi:hypothetical protein
MRPTFLAGLVLLATTPLLARAQSQVDSIRASIRRVAPDSFPELPPAVKLDLKARGCTVPQSVYPRGRNNVIRGSFTAAGKAQWAVLCSVRDTAIILVYDGAGRTPVDSLERSADIGWVQWGGSAWEYSRYLSMLPQRQIRLWKTDLDGRPIPGPIDHDAISQAFLDKSAEAFYWARGRWYRQLTAD